MALFRHAVIAGMAVLAACGSGGLGRSAPVVVLPASTEPRELTADEQVKQALSRLTFGPRPGDVARVTAMGLDRWLAEQLVPENVGDRVLDSLLFSFHVLRGDPRELTDSFPPQDIYIRTLRRAQGLPDAAKFVLSGDDSARFRALNDRGNRLSQQILAAKVARAAFSDRQLLEVMTDFWENHFSVYAGKMPTRFTLLEYDRDVIRPRALGKFRDLLGAVAKSPAMLYYLDNWQSRSDSLHPSLNEAAALGRAHNAGEYQRIVMAMRRRRQGLNENYARELMELHTLGVDGGYTQHDVIEVARALTGWSLQDPRAGGGFFFRPDWHDAEAKVVLGHVLGSGHGIEDGERVLDIVARHPSTARFVAAKLVRRFVSDSAPPALVGRAAATFAQTDGDIRQVLVTIVTSHEFYSRAAYRSKVKTPFELVVSTMRALGATADTTPRTAQLVGRLGQPVFGRLTPDGWPDQGAAWMNTGAILERINFGMNAAAGRVPGMSLDRWPPAPSLRGAPLPVQVDGVIAALFGGDVSTDTREILTSGRNPLGTTGDMAQAGRASMAPAPLGLPALVGLALGAPEFQRR